MQCSGMSGELVGLDWEVALRGRATQLIPMRACQAASECRPACSASRRSQRPFSCRHRCRHAQDLAKWEAAVGEARAQQAAAAAAAHEAQRAQQLAEASRGLLAELERALDARESKMQDSWKALKAQLAHVGDGGAGLLLHSDQRLKVGSGWLAAVQGLKPAPYTRVSPGGS